MGRFIARKNFEISKAFKIPLNDMEWVAAFHAKKEDRIVI